MQNTDCVPTSVKPNLTNRGYALVYFLSFITLGLSSATLGPMVPKIAESIGSTISAVSFLISVKSLGYFIGTFRGGKLFDRLPGHRILVICFFLAVLLMLLVPVMPSVVYLAFIILLIGTCEGVIDVGANLLIFWKFKKNVAPYLNILHFCFGVGSLISPLIIANLINLNNSVKIIYWTIPMLFLPSIIGLLLLPSPKIQNANSGSSIKQDNRLSWLIIIVMILFLYVGVEISYGNWIYTYSLNTDLATSVGAAYLTSVYWGSFTFGRLLGIFLSRIVDSIIILYLNLIGSSISLLLLILFPETKVILWIATISLGLFMASTFPTLLIIAERQLNISGALTGLMMTGAGLGGVVFPFLLSILYNKKGPVIVPSTLFFVMSITVVLYLLLNYSLRKHKTQE